MDWIWIVEMPAYLIGRMYVAVQCMLRDMWLVVFQGCKANLQ